MDQNILNKLTISGFRGIIGEILTPESVALLAQAFAITIKEKMGKNDIHLLIARDGRNSGEEIEQNLVLSLTNSGVNVTVVGIVTTPSVLYLTKTLTFDGAIIITASHNPVEYNGLKFITSDGKFASHEIIKQMKAILCLPEKELIAKIDSNMGDKKSEAIIDTTLGSNYINHVISSFSKLTTKPRVMLDPVNSSGSIMGPEFLRGMGAEVITIYDDITEEFERPPEPNPAALSELGRATLGYGMDVGFGLDPDADRLVVVDENGLPVFEEYTLALCARAFYEKLKKEDVLNSAGPLVVNMSTSKTVIDVAKEYGVDSVLSPVGEANVVNKMIENNSMFGGEGSGGVIFRPVNFGRDSFVGMALILNLMEESGKKISELVAELPKYIMLKDKISGINDFKSYTQQIKSLFPDATVNEDDGLRFDFSDSSWIQVRASNTEPIVRIIGEAKEEARIVELADKVKSILF